MLGPVLGEPCPLDRLDSRAPVSSTVRLSSREDPDRCPTDICEGVPSIVFGPFITTPVCVMSSGAGISTTSILIATIDARPKMPNMSGEGEEHLGTAGQEVSRMRHAGGLKTFVDGFATRPSYVDS